MAVEMPMRPMEEEKDSEKQDREWKQVVGGLVPRFLKRRTQKEQTNSKQEVDTRVFTVHTLLEYKKHVVEEPSKLVVVRFYAPWCKSCKAAEPMFKKLVSRYGGETGSVKFVQVPLTKETAYIHEGLGVPSVPYAHIYHPEGGLVEEMKINKRVFCDFKSVLEQYVDGECELPSDEESELEDNGFQ
jgi:thiol-disulfide isomerase/thioredoxin